MTLFNNQLSPSLLFQVLDGEVLFPEIFQTLDSRDYTSVWGKTHRLRFTMLQLCGHGQKKTFLVSSWPAFPWEVNVIENDDIKWKHFLSHWGYGTEPLLFTNENIPMGQICKIHMMSDRVRCKDWSNLYVFVPLPDYNLPKWPVGIE